jgi:hypothetical protein
MGQASAGGGQLVDTVSHSPGGQDAVVSDNDSHRSHDPVAAMLSAIEERLRSELAGVATVHRRDFPQGDGYEWEVQPHNARSLAVRWLEFGDEIILQSGGHGRGGRWELERTPETVGFIEAIVRGVAAGGAQEVTALARSRVQVALADGTVAQETGYEGCASVLVPLPGWTRWGRITRYQPYE